MPIEVFEKGGTNDRRFAIADGGPIPRTLQHPSTLWDALEKAALTEAGIVAVDSLGNSTSKSYQQLRSEAEHISGGLLQSGLQPGERIILQLSDPHDFLAAVWGCLHAGIAFAPVTVSGDYSHAPAAAARLRAVWELLGEPAILTTSTLHRSMAEVEILNAVLCIDFETVRSGPATLVPPREPEDIAAILLTSGSMGKPKAVPLRDRNLIAMALGTIQLNGFHPDDVALNWLPLDHVGALSFLHFLPVILGCRQVHVRSEYVLADALRWLDLLDHQQATISWAPNFAYRLINDRLALGEERSWNLSAVRFLVNAGEAVVPSTMNETIQRLGRYGLRERAIRPAFGMSESCSGITWSRGYHPLSSETSLVNLGPPIPGAAIRVTGDDGEILCEGQIGELELKGTSLFDGYLTREGVDRSAFTVDGWFRTGDLGFLDKGELTVTGRSKDVIIIHGVHYHAHDIETVAETVEGIVVSFTAAISVRQPGDDTDRLALVFVPESGAGPASAELLETLAKTLLRQVGIQPDVYIALPKEEIPKTNIGKIQRLQLKQRFQEGRLTAQKRTTVSSTTASQQGQKVAIEPDLIRVWGEVLNCEAIGVNVSFFDLGGTSILLPQLENRMREELGLSVSTADILAYPSIRMLGKHLSGEAAAPSISRSSKLTSRDPDGSIAIIGMFARFPGCDGLEQFWDVLSHGRETIADVTDEELANLGVSEAMLRDPNYVKRSSWLEGVESFDAEYFGIPADEARLLDPQQRLFLECVVHTLEDAAYDPLRYAGRIGVYASTGINTYVNLTGAIPDLSGDFQRALGAAAADYLSTRVSYKLNLRGPSFTIQTACSSALVAVHLACRALQSGDCDMAIAGASSVWSPRRTGYLHSPGGLSSPDGRCRAFDADASGMVFGNGVAAVLLKPLAKAREEGDRIRGILRSTAVNNDGSAKIGFWATGVKGQEEVIREAIDASRYSPDQIDYVECHGTGTVLGDAIELTAIERVFGKRRGAVAPLRIGSVKTNIGHMGVACGLAGLIKVALAMENGQIPPSLHYAKPNPQINIAQSGIQVASGIQNWPSPRRAGVSSFGLGGTNAHIVVEEGGVLEISPATVRTISPNIFPLSARSHSALDAMTQRLADFCEIHPKLDPASVAFTLQMGRREFSHRRVVVAADIPTLVHALRTKSPDRCRTGKASSQPLPVSFSFAHESRVSPQTIEQLAGYDSIRRILQAASRIWQQASDALSPATAAEQWTIDRAEEPIVINSRWAGIVVPYAVAKFLEELGLHPRDVIGKGLGLLTASLFAEAVTFEETVRLVAKNAETHPPSIDRLRVLEILAAMDFKDPRLAVIHSDSGAEILRANFASLLQSGIDDGNSPAPRRQVTQELSLNARDVWSADEQGTASIHRSGEAIDDISLPYLLADSWLAGHSIHWEALYEGQSPRRVALPLYPFERRRYWIDHLSTAEPRRTSLPQPSVPRAAEIPSGMLVEAAQVAPQGALADVVANFIEEQVAALLNLPSKQIDRDTGLFDVGLSSIHFVELAHRLETAMNQSLRPTLALEYPTIRELATHLAEELLQGRQSETREAHAAIGENSVPSLPDINELSEAEVLRMLQEG